MGHMPIRRLKKHFQTEILRGSWESLSYWYMTMNWDRVNYCLAVNLRVSNASVPSGCVTDRHEYA